MKTTIEELLILEKVIRSYGYELSNYDEGLLVARFFIAIRKARSLKISLERIEELFKITSEAVQDKLFG